MNGQRQGEDGDAPPGWWAVDPDVSCERCEHFEVCAVYQGFKPMLDNWQAGDPPVDATDLAKVCSMYDERPAEEIEQADG